ncbi:hypothetical protein [Thermostichus vulcanus]|uniref:Uncharacterized protein n=1 Tax=Thermostichus vulcanus str. 'Rupite' TaxID=2813851 RepID=A0ABT0CEL5_THEVL|nr:hypothetical protein [Thermostichus vulcanus]MCJ2544213.1 hypothetical protein [Thermostichus vulcanus str. 'Rupite']
MLLTHYYIRLEEALRHSWPRSEREAVEGAADQNLTDPEQETLALAHRIELEQARLAQEYSLHQLEYSMRRSGFL